MKKVEQLPNKIDMLFDNIRKIRLLLDIVCHINKIEETKPEFIDETEGFFKTNFKKIKNSIKNDFYKKAVEGLETKVRKYNLISDEEISVYHRPNYLNELIEKIKEESKKIANEIFKDDSYKVGKIEFVMNVLCDDYAEYKSNSKANEIVSKILNEDIDFTDDVLESLSDAYQKIGIKPTSGFNARLEEGALTGLFAMILANPIISAGIVGLSFAECITALCGIKFSFFKEIKNEASDAINSIQKERIVKAFYSLDVDQTAFYLAKSTVLLLQINKYRTNDPVAQEIYESYVESYIDIKSDITLKMLLDGGFSENINKAKVFNNMDIYLATALQTA